MKVLLDTNAFIWSVTRSERIAKKATRVIAATDSILCVSSASLWECAIKIGKGNLPEVGSSIRSLLYEIESQSLLLLPIEARHLLRLERLPHLHKDPFDRLLIAQALEEDLPVITADRIFSSYGVHVIW